MIPTSTDVSIDIKNKSTAKAIAVFITEGALDAGPSGALLTRDEQDAVSRLIAAGVSKGKAREIHFDILPGKGKDLRRLWLAGLGKPDKITLESLRQAAGAVAKACR